MKEERLRGGPRGSIHKGPITTRRWRRLYLKRRKNDRRSDEAGVVKERGWYETPDGKEERISDFPDTIETGEGK